MRLRAEPRPYQTKRSVFAITGHHILTVKAVVYPSKAFQLPFSTSSYNPEAQMRRPRP